RGVRPGLPASRRCRQRSALLPLSHNVGRRGTRAHARARAAARPAHIGHLRQTVSSPCAVPASRLLPRWHMKLGCMVVTLLAGCGAADTAETDHAPLPPMEQPDQPLAATREQRSDRTCPLAWPGAQMLSEVTADGVALVFTTSGGDAAELRARV